MAAIASIWNVLKTTVSRFLAHDAMTLAAALAFYTIFSLAPILVIVIGIAGVVWSDDAARDELVQQASGSVGEEGAQVVQTVLENADTADGGIIAIIIGSVTTIIGATVVFAQLKAAMNTMWDIQPKSGQPILTLMRDRAVSFIIVLAIALLLIVSVAARSTVSLMTESVAEQIGAPPIFLSIVHLLLALAIMSLLFALLLKYVPDAEVQWRDVWIGAVVTAILFLIGEAGLTWYLGRGTVASSYGAAGSLVMLLLWIYYSAVILLFGVQFTREYSDQIGRGVRPADTAQQAPSREVASSAA